ncbi:MAG: thiamine pyrophosphate-binding protein [Chloroflexi bacterium]|nr:thiamine pyrophosphate-binding protein [Chloroflexota bacterium]MCI0812136.1 thiamine pyrophosphate-binding protein [Chloroflexota bacterium]MCI0848376.1 thiamine pyrophosphate-binding protein [Chloroflexota bacterium]MCI0862631.1 thiamine pyrophosphate-binding protein [Chloroflexota bacterium]MCI0900097.1 thiamine pyrophosphate-binding protein [Chloroflexota bacterium]
MPQRKDGGDAILEALRKLDVDYIISSPGSEWPAVWEALARQAINEEPGPKYINCWHETLAVAMAQGYTRMTGRMQAVLLHAGVGVLQGSMGIHGAFQGEIPMLVASGETGTYGEAEGFDPGPQWLRNLSIVGGPNRLVESITKWSSRVTSAEVLYETFSRAGEMAQRTPKGPTFLNVPMETMLAEWTPPAGLKNKPPAPKTRPESSAIERIADLVIESKHPVILADSSGQSAEGFNALVTLAETMSIPVFESEGPGYANFPNNHPLHNGYDLKPRYGEFDLFLVAGTRAPWYPGSARPANGTVVIIDENPIKEFMAYQDLGADHYLEGDLPLTLQLLADSIKAKGGKANGYAGNGGVWEKYQAINDAAANASPIDPGVLCNALNEALPSDTIYIDETIVHRPQILRRIHWDNPQSYLRPTGGLGQGLGTALGAKLAAPDRPVVALMGDGSLLYNPITQALGVARESSLPIMIVVFNNSSYAAMKRLHLSFYPDGDAAKSGIFHGVDIPGPDYQELVSPFGGHGEKVEDPKRLAGAIKDGLAAVAEGRVAILDVVLSG